MLFSHKKNEILSFAATYIEDIMLHEINQVPTDQYLKSSLTFIC